MRKVSKIIILFVLFSGLLFYANVQSGAISSKPDQGWNVERAEEGIFTSNSRPVVARASGFSKPVAGGLQNYEPKKIEPLWRQPLLPGILAPHTEMRDRSQESPLQAAAPPLQKNFDGIKFHNFWPSDSTIAAGPTNIVVATNSSFAIFTKTGAKRAQLLFTDFFDVLTETSGAFFFDPILAYDPAGHFLMVVDATRDTDRRNWYILAVSDTTSAEGNWHVFALDMGKNGNAKTPNWSDYPQFGFDTKSIYLSGNMFNWSTGHFAYAKLRILNKNQVYGFQTLSAVDKWNLKDAGNQLAFTIQPARSIGAPAAEFMISGAAGQSSFLTLWSVQGTAIAKKKVPVTAYQIFFPQGEVQKGGGSLLDTGDARMGAAVWLGGSIYSAHSISHDWGSGKVAAIRVYQIHTPDGQVLFDQTYGADKTYYTYPAVTPDLRGNIAVVFVRSSSNEFVSVRFTGKKASESNFESSFNIRTGSANYFLQPENGVERWGDYSGVSLDPTDQSIWMFAMYAGTNAEKWKTRVGKTRFP